MENPIGLTIDGRPVRACAGQTVLEAARGVGIDIPTLCHDGRLKPHGACGLCVVEVSGRRKLARACGTAVSEGMAVQTQSPRVRAARRAVLELMLSDHAGDCRPPCQLACPASTDCQAYAALIAQGRFHEAVAQMRAAHPLPASIGLVCPRPCEAECRRRLRDEPVNLARLKSFAAQWVYRHDPLPPATRPDTGRRAAVVGGGPAGLTAAYFLRLAGHAVEVFDRMPQMGGLLRYGIPAYRLPKGVLDQELKLLERAGVVFRNRRALGVDFSLRGLRNEYDAVILATGAGTGKPIGCPGETLPHVVSGIGFLRQVGLGEATAIGARVVVVGGSNTAIDAARSALRLGAHVTVAYRRARGDMPADPQEVAEAEAEGVAFRFLAAPLEITEKDSRAVRVRLQLMTPGEPDAGGRRAPVPIPGAEQTLTADTVIAAVGQDVCLSGLEELPVTARRGLRVHADSYATEIPGVYAVGDVTGQGAYAIEAIGHARRAAAAAHTFLTGEAAVPALPPVLVKDTKKPEDYIGLPKQPRRSVTGRRQARLEASRCMECGCAGFDRCKLIQNANAYAADPGRYPSRSRPSAKPDGGAAYTRDLNKCVRCGLCVRYCEEIKGRAAVYMTRRGYDAAPMPAFGTFSACGDCAECVDVCPTGALAKRTRGDNPTND